VAEVSGKSYIEYARENILIPLGMENTDFTYASEAMIEKAATGAFLTDEVEAVIAMLDEIRGRGDGPEVTIPALEGWSFDFERDSLDEAVFRTSNTLPQPL